MPCWPVQYCAVVSSDRVTVDTEPSLDAFIASLELLIAILAYDGGAG